MSIYDFTVQAQDGNAVPLSEYKGKFTLIQVFIPCLVGH